MRHVGPTLPEVAELVRGRPLSVVDAPAMQLEVGEPLRDERTLVAPEVRDHHARERGPRARGHHGRAKRKHDVRLGVANGRDLGVLCGLWDECWLS